MTALLGKYRLDARLGGGGMAEVFLGSTVGAEGFSRKVAIKRVLPGFSDNPAFAKMFVDEARISSRLVHPNIVSVVDFDRDPEGRLYLVMELVEGKDLDGLASSGPLPIPVVIFVISEVLRGLGHAHDLPVDSDVPSNANTIRAMRGLVHRDVSPHNVLLSWEGAVKVSDFGIAKARTASQATASVFIKGKPAYMSPEQANGEQLDGRSDLFAVGVMLWELLVGRRLFVGEDTRATLAAVLFGQIPRPRALRSDVPKDLEKVVMKLLERERASRYATAEAALKDLLACDAAPKDGRELLKQILSERFPQQAPIRHSVMKSRGGQTPPQPQPAYQALPPHAQTLAQGEPAAALSIGSQRGAHTATMPQGYVGPAAVPVPRSNAKIVIIVASSIAAAAVVFVIVMATRGAPAAPAPKTQIAAQGSAPVEPVAAVVPDASAPMMTTPPPAPPDAAAAAAVAETPPLPVGSGSDEAKKDATRPRPGEKRMGRLVVKAFPIATVYIDNKRIHDSPVEIDLPVGKHQLRLQSSDDKNEVSTVTIEEHKTTTIDRN